MEETDDEGAANEEVFEPVTKSSYNSFQNYEAQKCLSSSDLVRVHDESTTLCSTAE